MDISRRNFAKYMSIAPVALGAMSSIVPVLSETGLANVCPTAFLGSITGNDPASYLAFAQWFGRKSQLAVLAFNQTSASALSSSISYICQQGSGFMADGAQILWSVPCPGAKQLEAITAGNYNSLYTTLFQSILAVSPADSSHILVRLPWEFNLAGQQNSAQDQSGNWNGTVFIAAWKALVTLCRSVSARFRIIWCPNVCTQAIDPQACWPGVGYVDIIAQDFYMQSAYNKAGDFSWFLNEARGLAWGASFAHTKGKPYALSEWGMDSDSFVGDLNSAASWLSGLGKVVHHHCWWDRSDVIDCTISDGSHPGLAAAYKSQFV